MEKAYTGDRLRQTLDWSLSSVGDDVTAYTSKLSEMERRLFLCGAIASASHTQWKMGGNSRRLVFQNKQSNQNAASKKTASSAEDDNDASDPDASPNKRRRVQ